MTEKGVVGQFQFGENTIYANRAGWFTINLVHGGAWVFDLGEIKRLAKILDDMQYVIPPFETHFRRTNGSNIIQVRYEGREPTNFIYLIEDGWRKGYFWHGYLGKLLNLIDFLTILQRVKW